MDISDDRALQGDHGEREIPFPLLREIPFPLLRERECAPADQDGACCSGYRGGSDSVCFVVGSCWVFCE